MGVLLIGGVSAFAWAQDVVEPAAGAAPQSTTDRASPSLRPPGSPDTRLRDFALFGMTFAVLALLAVVVRLRAQARQLRELQSSDRAKTELLAKASHEVRNPVHGILGLSELLLGSEVDPTRRRILGAIRDSAEGLGSLANDFLDHARLLQGRVRLTAEPTAIRQLVQSTAMLFQGRADHHNIALSVRIDPEVPEGLLLDKARFRQVLANLLGNAIKFTLRGAVAVRVEYLGAPQRLQLAVSDTGPGMDALEVEELFTAFRQGKQGRLQASGTGLGLTITKELIELMDGTIRVESAPGTGSTFRVEIAAPLAEVPPSEPQAAEPRHLDFASLRALVVDDDPTSRLLLVSHLEHLGVLADGAGGGPEAIAACAQARYDVVISDYEMPGMSGGQLARTLRDEPARFGRPRLILLSGHSRERLPDAPFDRFLLKPVSMHDITDALSDIAPAAAPAPASGPTETSAPNVAPPVLDESRLRALAALGRDGRRPDVALAEVFLRGIPERLTRIAEAVAAADHESVRTVSHSWKGAAAALGAERLANFLREVEDSAAHRDLETPHRLLPVLGMESLRVVEALKRMLPLNPDAIPDLTRWSVAATGEARAPAL